MLVWYMYYSSKNTENAGYWFQCDKEDFIQFFKHKPDDILRILVKTEDGRVFQWIKKYDCWSEIPVKKNSPKAE